MRKALRSLPLLLISLQLTGCIAFSVGTTARPVPAGEFHKSMSVFFVPSGIETAAGDDGWFDEDELAWASGDFQGRWGLSEQSELGLRVLPGGAIGNYKRLINGPNNPDRLAVSLMAGTGVVNFGNHVYFEGGLIASGREDGNVPYGGVRAMHVLPLSSGAVSDTPTVGFFGGTRFRVNRHFSISPELGIYLDDSALKIRDSDIVVIPSISLHWH